MPAPIVPVAPPEAVAAITVERCDGSGDVTAVAAAVAPDRLVTVAHAFVDAGSLAVVDSEGESVTAAVVYLDEDRDISLLELADHNGGWFELGRVHEGDAVTVLAPGGEDGIASAPTNIVRVVDVSIDGVGLRAGLELDANIEPGRSGAPVVDGDGVMVGMAFAADRDARNAWAIAASEIEAALAQPTGGPIELSC